MNGMMSGLSEQRCNLGTGTTFFKKMSFELPFVPSQVG